jgi:hypothetical protein
MPPYPDPAAASVAKRRRDWKYVNHHLNEDLTLPEYEARLAAQGGVCAICDRPPRPYKGKPGRLDLDHAYQADGTKLARDLICNRCNRLVGVVERHWKLLVRIHKYVLRWARVHRQQAQE